MAIQIVLAVLGLMLIVFPQMLQADPEQRYDKRLEELRNGADEAFFEERRELEAYKPRGYWPTRALGAFLVIIALSKALFE
jgi:hypothetical protein